MFSPFPPRRCRHSSRPKTCFRSQRVLFRRARCHLFFFFFFSLGAWIFFWSDFPFFFFALFFLEGRSACSCRILVADDGRWGDLIQITHIHIRSFNESIHQSQTLRLSSCWYSHIKFIMRHLSILRSNERYSPSSPTPSIQQAVIPIRRGRLQ